MRKTTLDPIKFEVIRNALTEATEEMSAALKRSAYSTNIKTRCDFSCTFFDENLRPIAQSFGQPTFLGSMVRTVQYAIKQYGIANLSEGDGILTNHPYNGGVHLNDICLISPVFYQGHIVGFVANLAHHIDVGGGAPASIGAFKEVYQEGVIIPAVKFVEKGHIVNDIFNLILSQVRAKRENTGDFRAQIASNATGIRRFQALFQSIGETELKYYIEELIAYADRRTQADINMLPRGEYEAEGYIDNDGYTDKPVLLKVRIVIDSSGVLFDFTGTDSQRKAPVNASYAMTFSACVFVLKCIIDEDIPVNAGYYKHVRLIAPEGSIVNCTTPYPVVGGWETHVRLIDVMLKACSLALPEKMPAGTKGTNCQIGSGGIDPRRNEFYCFYEAIGGGFGGRIRSDGPDAVGVHGQNTQNAPVEETEQNYPLRISRYELIDDSGGAGKHRGGLGIRRDYELIDHDASMTILSDRDHWGPWGLFGGHAGEKAYYIVNPKKESTFLGSKLSVDLKSGTTLSFRTPGGGGYGLPEERDPNLVLKDVRDGKVSPVQAALVYKVAVNKDLASVDDRKTQKLRNDNV
jgi:N-methylhydantoinase B